jgi:predicted enzyme related to lactoylglutathione lyase
MRVGMTSVFVNNPLEAHKFYTEVLGFQSKMFMPEMYLAIVVSPEQPEGPMLLLEPNNNPIASSYQQAVYKAGMPPIVFSVNDIQQEYRRLKDKGVVFRGEPKKDDFGWSVLLEDTCGNLIQLHQQPG